MRAKAAEPVSAPAPRADPLLRELVEGVPPARAAAERPAAPMPRPADQVDRGVLDSLMGDGEKDKK